MTRRRAADGWCAHRPGARAHFRALWSAEVPRSPSGSPPATSLHQEIPQVETKVFSVTHLAAVLIVELKHWAEAHLGRDTRHAVIAVPRRLSYRGRQDLLFAASTWGGFRGGGVKAIDQQIAAATVYGHHTLTHTEEQGDGKTILVLRVGGRTSDATIFKFVHGGGVRYVCAQDDYFLGGFQSASTGISYKNTENQVPV